MGQPEFAWLAARIPSLAMWDDHDISDGWGSYPDPVLDSEVGRCIFSAARESFILFQLGAAPGELPDRCLDRAGKSLSWSVQLPGLQIVAPDLRSERRRDRVMGKSGWDAFRTALGETGRRRVLVLSSVPALGPRLAIVERIMYLTPSWEEYQDDLNDQWQSIRHKEEWRSFLRDAIALHERDGIRVTFLSGEIHLATRERSRPRRASSPSWSHPESRTRRRGRRLPECWAHSRGSRSRRSRGTACVSGRCRAERRSIRPRGTISF